MVSRETVICSPVSRGSSVFGHILPFIVKTIHIWKPATPCHAVAVR
jgi:hypothetical protein